MSEIEQDIVGRIRAHVREERAAEPDAEAMKPLGDAAVDRIVARVARKPAAAAPATGAKPGKPGNEVIAFPRWARIYAGPIAVAAAVVLFVATRDHGEHGPALPDYGITASGEQAMRGDARNEKASTLRIGKGATSTFEIVARPATSVGVAKVVAYVFAVEAGDPVAVDANVEVSKDGAVRITGDARKLGSAKELRIVLATPESIGGYTDAADRAKSAQGDAHVKVIAVTIERM